MLPLLVVLMTPMCVAAGATDEVGLTPVPSQTVVVDGWGHLVSTTGEPKIWLAAGSAPPPRPEAPAAPAPPPPPPQWMEKGELPRVWLGVRITPVPAPLAAHIGAGGIMINNVVSDSPADKAGLEQYDVVVRFDDVEIHEPQDLTAAIAEAEPGALARLAIIRGGQREELRIRPMERPADLQWEMKYDEPESMVLKDAVEFRGRALQLGPDGQWRMHDLGDLQGLHGVFDKLHGMNFNKFNFQFDAEDFFPDLEMRVLEDDDELTMFFSGGDGVSDAKSSFRIEILEDGERTSIHRDAEGLIHVTRGDEEGEEITTTYEDPDVLAEEDPEAFELYNEHLGEREFTIYRRVEPGSHGAQRLQQRFQIDVRRRVEEALDRAREAHERATERAQEAYEEAVERAREIEELEEELIEKRAREQEHEPVFEEEAATRVLGFGIDEEGFISLTIVNEHGEVEELAYESAAEFREHEPELYERVRSFLE